MDSELQTYRRYFADAAQRVYEAHRQNSRPPLKRLKAYEFTTVTLSGLLLTNLAAYFAAGHNTICIYNPSPVESSHGYSNNYLQWSSVTLTVTYTEGVSVPTVSSSSVNLGSAVTISTNHLTDSATHTLTYAFGSATGTIATNVGASVSWTPGLALAAQIPNATSGLCTVTCKTFVGGTETGSSSVTLMLNVPSSVIPTITNVSTAEATSGIASQFGGHVRTRSKLTVGISASGAQGSTISAYRTTLDNVTYNRFIVHVEYAEYSGYADDVCHGDGFPRAHGDHEQEHLGAGLFAALADEIQGRTMQQQRQRCADGRHEGARVAGRLRFLRGQQEHDLLHRVLQAVHRNGVDTGCDGFRVQLYGQCHQPPAQCDPRRAQELSARTTLPI